MNESTGDTRMEPPMYAANLSSSGLLQSITRHKSAGFFPLSFLTYWPLASVNLFKTPIGLRCEYFSHK